jgi:hypothetical protein
VFDEENAKAINLKIKHTQVKHGFLSLTSLKSKYFNDETAKTIKRFT